MRRALVLALVLLATACAGRESRTPGEPPSTVTVRRGDTVYGIARRHGVGVRAVIAANRLAAPYVIRVGQRLILPRPRVHVVARGDTVYSIARRYRLPQRALIRANRIRPPYTIRLGQRLRLPGAVQSAARTPPQTKAMSKTRATGASKPRKKLPPPAPRAGAKFLWPVRGSVLSGFGAKAGGLYNDGINIAAPRGTGVRAAENGVVAYAGSDLKAFGNLVLIKHAGGWMTAYGHNESLLVGRGQRVKRGQAIARVGSTGNVIRPQLHFEIRKDSDPVDPGPLLLAAGPGAELAAVTRVTAR